MATSWPWLAEGLNGYANGGGQGYNPPVEYGIDLPLPQGTPITSLTSGTVLGAGYYGGGGVVSVGTTVSGKPASVYYQHLDLIASGIAPGATVAPGELLGYSGGQLSGGNHPSTPQFSSGPHIEVGLNAPYGGMWAPLGPNMDPTGWLMGLNANGAPIAVGFVGMTAQAATNQVPGIAPLLESLHEAEQWHGLDITNPIGSVLNNGRATVLRAVVILVGLIILAGVVFNTLKGNLEVGMEELPQAATTAAGAGI